MAPKHKSNLIRLTAPPTVELSDSDLVKAVAAGDKAALCTVWDRYISAVRGTLRALLGNDPMIDDLAQEAFLTFYRSAGRVRDQKALRPYLLGAAAKLAAFELRTRTRRNRWHRLFHWSLGQARVGRPNVEERDALRSLRAVLERLPERERQAFVLRYVQDLSPSEVAEALSLPKGTAKRAIAEGRRRVLARAQKEPALAEYLAPGEETA